MIYELRIYRCVPGRKPALLSRFENETLRIWEKHGIRQAGFWTTLIGNSSEEITYMLAWDSMALLMICHADMLSTLYFVHAHMATESNPVMAYWLSMGDGAFCAAKVISFLPLLFVAAYYRASRPKLVQVSLRGAIVLYLTIYVVAVGSQGIMHA